MSLSLFKQIHKKYVKYKSDDNKSKLRRLKHNAKHHVQANVEHENKRKKQVVKGSNLFFRKKQFQKIQNFLFL